MNVLISGVGIAGPTLAYWLVRHGYNATLVEKAPQLRTGGYIIDFWGSGYDVAERMGLLTELERVGYHVRELRIVNSESRRVGGFDVSVVERIAAGRYISLPRGELAAAIYRATEGSVETIFGDEIIALENGERDVRVQFAHGRARTFDLVIGADGLHSRVRSLAFGPQSKFEMFLGYKVAASEIAGYRPRDELVYVVYSPPGKQVGRFAMREDRTLALFVFADHAPGEDVTLTPAGKRAVLEQEFGTSGWECRQILDAIRPDEELYFDRVSQIRMPRWTNGRVGLVGDAAFCVSLVAGQGAALAMVSAYVLAGELKVANSDPRVAFENYERRLSKIIAVKQKAAVRFARSFAPRSRLRAFVRNQVTKLMSLPLVARFAFGRTLVDRFELPPY